MTSPKTRTGLTIPTGVGMFRPATDGGDDPMCANCLPATTCGHKHRSEHRLITKGSTAYIGGCRSTRHRCRLFTLAVTGATE